MLNIYLAFMKSIQSVCVCGAGTMGSGIAQVFAVAGFDTIQFDVNEGMLEKSKALIEKNLLYLYEKGKITEIEKSNVLKRIHFTNDINDCKADIIVEAIIEKLETKISLFQQLQTINNSDTIYTSNTSSISIEKISDKILFADQFAGLHFFNPAPVMKLVELIVSKQTSTTTIETLTRICKQINKTAVVCKDSPGFIVNRVARHYYLEAMKLVELYGTDIATIDELLQTSGFKMGPFVLMDLIGMDINYSVSNIVWNDLGKPERLKPSVIQQQKVEAGELGRKSGKGFYQY